MQDDIWIVTAFDDTLYVGDVTSTAAAATIETQYSISLADQMLLAAAGGGRRYW